MNEKENKEQLVAAGEVNDEMLDERQKEAEA